jgi:hypothetical protein
VVVFPQLSQPEIFAIVDLMIAKLDARLRDKDMGIELTEAAKKLLSEKGYDPVLGARPLRRAIQREIEDALSEKILFGELKAGQQIVVDAQGEGILGEFVFRGEERPRGAKEPVSVGAHASVGTPGSGTDRRRRVGPDARLTQAQHHSTAHEGRVARSGPALVASAWATRGAAPGPTQRRTVWERSCEVRRDHADLADREEADGPDGPDGCCHPGTAPDGPGKPPTVAPCPDR